MAEFEHEIPKVPAVLPEKLRDAALAAEGVEFDPDEAEAAGAFLEDAIDEAAALESRVDADE